MATPQTIHHYIGQIRWRLIVALVIYSSVFSGYPGITKSLNRQSVQTQLICADNDKFTKHTVLFQNLFVAKYKRANSYTNPKPFVLLICNSKIKAKLRNTSKQFNSTKTTLRFIQLKTIPLNFTEDVLLSITG